MGKEKVEVEIVASDSASGKLDGLLGTLGKVAGGVGKGLLAIGGAAIAGGAAVGALVSKTAEIADGLVVMSDQSGLSITKLQELKYAAGQTGVEMGSITGSIGLMIKNMANAPEAFDALGISITNADGSMRSSEAVFSDALTTLEGIENPTLRAQAAFDLFGKGAQGLLPLVSQGKGALQGFSAEANNLGIILDENGVRAAEGFGDAMETLKASIGALGQNLAISLMPFLTKVVNMLITNMPVIQAIIEPIFPLIIAAVETLLPILMELVQGILPLVVTLLTALMPIVTALIPVIIQVAQIIVLLVQALMPVIEALLPILVSILKFLTDLLAKYVIPAIKLFAEWLGKNIPVAMEALRTFWESKLKPTVEKIKEFFDKVANAIQGIIDAVKSVIDWFGRMIDKIKDIKLPDWLTPGSPTPFEIGLLGIADALENVEGAMPDFNVPVTEIPTGAGAGIFGGAGAAGGVVPITINYQPLLSLSDETELRTKLAPIIIDTMKVAGYL